MMDEQQVQQTSVVDWPEMRLIGISITCPGMDFSQVGELWEGFAPRMGELPQGGRVFGLSYMQGESDAVYFAGLECSADCAVPEGMEEYNVPASRWFSQRFDDHPSKLGPAWMRIFGELINAAGEKPASCALCLEEYGPDWHDEAAGLFHITLYAQLG
jgi:predicted transcriptional regulator YdeE